MKELLIALLVVRFSPISAFQPGYETIPYRFYDELSNVADEQCASDTNKILVGLKKLEKWAIEIVDSSAKLPSGILRGNLNQFGDFDECIGAASDGGGTTGKYCLAAVKLNRMPFGDVIHAHHQVKNNLTDPSHYWPNLSTVYWGVCVPSSCGPNDVSSVLQSVAREFHDVDVLVDNDMCQTKRAPNFPTSSNWLLMLAAIVSVSCLIIVARTPLAAPGRTDPDVEQSVNVLLRVKNVLRSSFAIRKNFNSLFDSPSRDGFKCLNGIRVLSMIAILTTHMAMSKLYLPYLNKTDMSESMSKLWTITGRVLFLYTDSFLAISGLLAAITLSRSSPVKIIVLRYIRLTASLAAVIFIVTQIYYELGDGPMWNMIIGRNVELCRKYWWRNLLYIHNLFGIENMCLGFTHHLAIDFQLFVMAIPLMYLLKKSKTVALFLIVAIISISTVLRYREVKNNSLSTVLYFGLEISRFNRSFNTSYTLPAHRATVYFMGFLVGCWMKNGSRLNLSSVQVKTMWLIAVFCGLLSVFGPYPLSDMKYVYNSQHLAVFNAAGPILWCIFVLWCIVATDSGYGSWLSKSLRFGPLTFLSNISYAVYLVQYIVFCYYCATARGPSLHTLATMFDLSQLIQILVWSTVLTLVVDRPFKIIGKYLTEGANEKSKSF